MKTIEVNGRTVDEALETALKELKVDKDKVTVEIIDEGSRGFLNLIGAKPARIKVTVKRNAAEDAKVFLHDVLEVMGVNAKLDIKEEKGILSINISGDKMGLVIGYRGETLDSLQYLTSLVINKNHEDAVEFTMVFFNIIPTSFLTNMTRLIFGHCLHFIIQSNKIPNKRKNK